MIAKDGYVNNVTYIADVKNLYHISAANPRQTTMKSKTCQKELDETSKQYDCDNGYEYKFDNQYQGTASSFNSR